METFIKIIVFILGVASGVIAVLALGLIASWFTDDEADDED